MTTVLDWRKYRVAKPEPCRLCRRPAHMRDGDGKPCHKVCAEQHIDEVAARTARTTGTEMEGRQQ